VLAALIFAFANGVAAAGEAEPAALHRMVFTGDILLSRQVAREIEARGGVSPWRDIGDALKGAEFVLGNFEGAVGSMDDCAPPKDLCFAVSPRLVPLMREAGFTALGVANNHSGDLGAAGRQATRAALETAELAAAGLDQPVFFRLGPHTVGLVSLSLVPGRDGVVDAVPSWQAARALRLARALSDFVVVSVHWGKELADWVTPEQETQAKWLVAHGADVIAGAHPHVIQPAECVDGRPVFYSLGNHVFDQKYPETKRGLIAACAVEAGVLTCSGSVTRTPVNSSFPAASGESDAASAALSGCPVPARQRLTVAGQTLGPRIPGRAAVSGAVVLEGVPAADGVPAPVSDRALWRSAARHLLSIESGRLAADRPAMLFTVERHASPIDGEDGPRPYVYDVTPHGLVARWRGSALAWPLLDATLMTDSAGRAWVCALHRGDSFVMLDGADSAAPRTQVYAWNGFGFTGVTDGELVKRCAAAYGVGAE
jgi:poly-gamma-glutamate synthesis protein (capsule biosynthesis protein)